MAEFFPELKTLRDSLGKGPSTVKAPCKSNMEKISTHTQGNFLATKRTEKESKLKKMGKFTIRFGSTERL